MSNNNRNVIISNENQEQNLEVITNNKSKAFDSESDNSIFSKTRPKISEILGIKIKNKNILFDNSIFELQQKSDFLDVLNEIISPNEKIVVWFFEEQILYLDRVKKRRNIAHEILKLLAQDEENIYTKITKGSFPKPENLGEYCRTNKLVLVSGDANNIAWCKEWDAEIYIPTYFKKLSSLPYKGKKTELSVSKFKNSNESDNSISTNNQSKITKSSKKNNKLKKILFDNSILELPHKNNFFDVLNEIISPNEKIVIYLFEEQIIYLERIKKYHKVARSLLKFFAQDEERLFTRIIKDSFPKAEKLGKFCKCNEYLLVSGDAKNIAWCKAWSANIYIPTYFKELYPSPFKGTEIVGVDSNLLCHDFVVRGLSRRIKTIVIPDIQLREHGGFGCKKFHKVLAYYGEFGKAQYVNNNSDMSIVQFLKQKQIDKAYTNDFGFKVFAKIANLPTEIIYFATNSVKKLSKALQIIENNKNENFINLAKGSIINIDIFVDNDNGKLKIIKDLKGIWLNVYDVQNNKRESSLGFVDAFEYNVISIIKDEIILIVGVVSTSSATGKVFYFGEIKDVPPEYVKYLY